MTGEDRSGGKIEEFGVVREPRLSNDSGRTICWNQVDRGVPQGFQDGLLIRSTKIIMCTTHGTMRLHRCAYIDAPTPIPQQIIPCMSEATSADEATGVASDASVESAQETPTATTDPPANVPQNGRNGPGDMYLALKRMTHGVTRGYRGPRRV